MTIGEVGYSYNEKFITKDVFNQLIKFWDINLEDLQPDQYIEDRKIASFTLNNGNTVRVFILKNTISRLYQTKFGCSYEFPVMYSIMHMMGDEYYALSQMNLFMRTKFYTEFKIRN